MPIKGIGHYEPGTGRRLVRLNNGDVVPRATAENLYAVNRGFTSNYQRRQAFRLAKQSPTFERDVMEAARRTGTSREEATEAYGRLRQEYARKGNDWRQIDKSPDGALARYLTSIGRRSGTEDYSVGESPGI